MNKVYRIGTRTSPLALRQVEEVLGALKTRYPDFKTEIVGIDTYGDKDKSTPIREIEGSDFFTREIDLALLNGDIDFAVHSAKDLPDKLMDGLTVAAITEPKDLQDALVSRSGLRLNELPNGAIIGTSSMRRKEGLKKFRPDFKIVDIRGNIGERLALLETADRSLDAVVTAACALVRLGLDDRITERIPLEIITPHPMQGALAIVARLGDKEIINLFSELDKRQYEQVKER